VEVILTPKQEMFINAIEDEVFYGGAVGPGKSFGLLMFSLLRRQKIPYSHGLILRRSYPELEMSHIRTSKQLLAGTGAKYSEQHKRWEFPNGSILQFGYVERFDDLYRYNSAEFEDICIDEASEFIGENEYTFLMSRLRTTKPGVKCFIRLASNPGGKGHLFLKQRFVDVARNKTYVDPATGLTRRFIPATLDDNPYLDKTSYERRLAAMPEDLRRMYRHGDWDVFSGQVFEEFRREIHVVKPFKIPAWWRRWIANDPGYADHFAWYWLAADEDGNVYVYREYTNADGERIPYSRQAEVVVELTGDERIDFVVSGMDAFNRHPETGKSIVDYYREGGIPWGILEPVHGPGSRRIRTAVTHEYLAWRRDENSGRTVARLRIFDTCAKLIETLPILTADKNDPETVAKCGIDHYWDSFSYGICAYHPEQSKEPPKPKTWIQQDKERLSRKTNDFIRRCLTA